MLICGRTYGAQTDPITGKAYTPVQNPASPDYPGFDPASAPNNGEGFYKDIGNNMMPNAPPFTASLGAQYSMPVSSDWAVTFRADGYWQDNSWWRVFNDNEYDKLHGYATMNLTLILTSQAGWQVMLYDKNLFNTTAITGAFLNSDDSGLTTNVFLTDPKLIGVRVTKNW
jgi:outer membrane receptor protein involved in Fe transport